MLLLKLKKKKSLVTQGLPLSLIHLVYICTYGTRKASTYILFFLWGPQFHLLDSTFFPHWIFLNWNIFDIQHYVSLRCTTWPDTFIYCNIITNVVLISASIMSHNYHFLFVVRTLPLNINATAVMFSSINVTGTFLSSLFYLWVYLFINLCINTMLPQLLQLWNKVLLIWQAIFFFFKIAVFNPNIPLEQSRVKSNC